QKSRVLGKTSRFGTCKQFPSVSWPDWIYAEPQTKTFQTFCQMKTRSLPTVGTASRRSAPSTRILSFLFRAVLLLMLQFALAPRAVCYICNTGNGQNNGQQTELDSNCPSCSTSTSAAMAVWRISYPE